MPVLSEGAPDAARVVVHEGSTLCHRTPGGWLGVIAGDLLAGGRDWRDGAFPPAPGDEVRPATAADFERFRVCARGYGIGGAPEGP